MQVECVIPSPLALCCLSCCEVKLTSETPHPGHPCLDSFPVSSHLKIVEHRLPSPLVSDSYCSTAAHKSAALGCLLKGGSGSKVAEPCPLAPSCQMAPQGFSGCQERTLPLSHFTLLHSLTQLLLSPHVSPTLFLPNNSTHILFSPLGPRPTGLYPSSSSSLSLCGDSTPFLAIGDSSIG